MHFIYASIEDVAGSDNEEMDEGESEGSDIVDSDDDSDDNE